MGERPMLIQYRPVGRAQKRKSESEYKKLLEIVEYVDSNFTNDILFTGENLSYESIYLHYLAFWQNRCSKLKTKFFKLNPTYFTSNYKPTEDIKYHFFNWTYK